MRYWILSIIFFNGCITKYHANQFAIKSWIEGYNYGVEDGVENARFYIVKSSNSTNVKHWFENYKRIESARGRKNLLQK